MDAEQPDRGRPQDDSDADDEPAQPFWPVLLICLAGGLPLGLMAWGFHLALAPSPLHSLELPALLALLLTAASVRPKTFRHGAVVAAVATAVGALAMLCFLPVTMFAESYDFWTGRLVFRLPAAVLLAILGWWLAWLICRRLAVPLDAPAKGPSESESA